MENFFSWSFLSPAKYFVSEEICWFLETKAHIFLQTALIPAGLFFPVIDKIAWINILLFSDLYYFKEIHTCLADSWCRGKLVRTVVALEDTHSRVSGVYLMSLK